MAAGIKDKLREEMGCLGRDVRYEWTKIKEHAPSTRKGYQISYFIQGLRWEGAQESETCSHLLFVQQRKITIRENSSK